MNQKIRYGEEKCLTQCIGTCKREYSKGYAIN